MKKIIFPVIGAILIALSAQTALPIPQLPAPITLQSLLVISFAMLTNAYIGIFSVLIYLILGLLGLPFFAELSSGIAVLSGKSGGYLIGLIPAAFVAGYLISNKIKNNFINLFLISFLATNIILLFGYIWLIHFIGFYPAFKYGVLPFIIGAVIKSFLSAVIVSCFKKLYTAAS